MKVTQIHQFCIRRTLIGHTVQRLLPRVSKFCCFCPSQHIFLNIRNIFIYVARWWEMYLSKRSLLKHTCSWRHRSIILWTLIRRVKIFLRILAVNVVDFIFSRSNEIWKSFTENAVSLFHSIMTDCKKVF